MKKTYLDNNATTPIDPFVLQTMLPFLEKDFGNPSSAHRYGEISRDAIVAAREKLGSLLGTDPHQIIFTSCGTEANNHAIWSAIGAYPGKKHIIASQAEHASVLAPLHFLKGYGYEVELFPVGANGDLDLAKLHDALRPDTVLASFMAANNETGVIWPIAEIGAMCRAKGVFFHSDGVQLAGKEPTSLEESFVDYFALSAHKMHGPKGIGALWVRRAAPVRPLLFGGGQERGMRSGTENVSAIAGFGAAAQKALEFLPKYRDTLGRFRSRIEHAIMERFPDAVIHGQSLPRLANTVNVSFKYVSGAIIIQDLDERGFAISAHAACHGGDLNPSHVLVAMHVPEEYIHGALRISCSRFTKEEEITPFLDALFTSVEKFRHL